MSHASTVTPVPVSFTFEFDFDGNHCSGGVEYAAEFAPDDLAEKVRSLTEDDAIAMLEDEQKAATDHDDYDRADKCEEAAATLKLHELGCSCASDIWELQLDVVDDDLHRLGDHLWAVSARGEPVSDIQGELAFSDIRNRAELRNGWSRLRIEWDGSKLSVQFDGRSLYADLVYRVVPDDLRRFYELWTDDSTWDDTAASSILDTPVNVLEAAEELRDCVKSTDVALEFEECVEAITAAGFTDLTAEELEIVDGLLPAWEGALANLLRAARQLRREPVAA